MLTHLISKRTLIFVATCVLCVLLYQFEYTQFLWNQFNSRPITDPKNEVTSVIVNKTNSDLKYILQWTSAKTVPFVYMGVNQTGFIDRNCPYTNCIVTSEKSFLGDYSKFDVIAFAGPQVLHVRDLPVKRSPHQKYVWASIESGDNYPVCSKRFDGFFNWTWTYKLDSEVRWGYMAVRDRNNTIVGPNKIMNWMALADMDPVSEDFKMRLTTKTKAAAWFVSNCYSRSKREDYVKQLQKELLKYNLSVDIYGNCGTLTCSRDNEDKCDQLLNSKYYFYLSFENSFSEDYVTEKLLRALKNNIVPIVYGGANYTRFMPDGIYLNARELGVVSLAKKMHELINDIDQYADYFRWKKYYNYHGTQESGETNEYCLFCTILNKKDLVESSSVYHNFCDWWDPAHRCPWSN